jgi:hypothetical protein
MPYADRTKRLAYWRTEKVKQKRREYMRTVRQTQAPRINPAPLAHVLKEWKP